MAAPFVLPTIFSAFDKLTGPVRGMMRIIEAFGQTADGSGARAERAFSKIGSAADRAYKKLNVLPKLNSVLGAAGLGLSLGVVAEGVRKVVGEASKVEDAQASFQSLLGGLDKAKQLVADLYKQGASTPFEFEDLAKNAQMLIGFGVATKDNVVPMLNMLGDVAQGNAEKLGGITLAFSQIQAAGKANLGDINQLINNGVPILGQLAKQWKMSVGAAREAVSKGKASGAEITKAFKAMTSEGGMFFNGMAIASETFSGKVSTMKDGINQAFASIGQVVLPIAKEYVDKISAAADRAKAWGLANQDLIKSKVSEWVSRIASGIGWLIKNFDKIVFWTKAYVITLVSLRVILLATTVLTKGLAAATVAYNIVLGISTALQGKSAFVVMGNATAYAAFRVATVAATAAQWLLNAALTANPIGLVIVAIAALIAIVVLIIKYWDEWGASVAFLLGPLGMLISLIMSIKKNWKLVEEAFKTDGILGAVKAIGKVLLDAVLMPLQQILELASHMPGKIGEWAKQGADNIAAFREGMGIDTTDSERENRERGEAYEDANTPFPARVFHLADPRRFERPVSMAQINGSVQVDVRADKGSQANVSGSSGVVKPKVGTTLPYKKGM